jgi:HSP20 family protein
MSQTLPERRSSGQQDWSPFSELERLRRMLDETFGGFGARGLLEDPAGWAPAVDIEEQENAYVVEAELPGVKREDVNIELIGKELTITGELKEEEREGVLRRSARRRGRFDYRVVLPDEVDAENIEANLSDGVLTVRVPKSERAQRRRIEVQSS